MTFFYIILVGIFLIALGQGLQKYAQRKKVEQVEKNRRSAKTFMEEQNKSAEAVVKPKSWPNRHPIVTIAIVVVAFLIIIGAVSGGSQNNNTPAMVSSQQANPQPIDVSAAQLIADYGSNQVAADNKYKGPVLQVNGLLDSVNKDILGNPYIVIKASLDSFNSVQCAFAQGQESQLSALQHGDQIVVQGEINNYILGSPMLSNCSLIQANLPASGDGNAPAKITSPRQPASTQTQAATTQTPTPQAPPPTPKSWHTAYTYNNNIGIQTPPFSMQGSEWRINYSCTVSDSSVSYSNFNGIVDSATGGGGNVFAEIVNCPTSNTSYVYSQDPGQYYLDLDANNVHYTVTVEDYY